MAQPPYEFTSGQNTLLTSLAKYMKFSGLLFIFLGIVIGIFCSFTIVRNPLEGIAFLLQTLMIATIGVWTNFASYEFRQIAETAGNDMDLLMDALRNMKRLYSLQCIWVTINIAAILVLLILSFIMGYHLLAK